MALIALEGGSQLLKGWVVLESYPSPALTQSPYNFPFKFLMTTESPPLIFSMEKIRGGDLGKKSWEDETGVDILIKYFSRIDTLKCLNINRNSKAKAEKFNSENFSKKGEYKLF